MSDIGRLLIEARQEEVIQFASLMIKMLIDTKNIMSKIKFISFDKVIQSQWSTIGDTSTQIHIGGQWINVKLTSSPAGNAINKHMLLFGYFKANHFISPNCRAACTMLWLMQLLDSLHHTQQFHTAHSHVHLAQHTYKTHLMSCVDRHHNYQLDRLQVSSLSAP